MTDLATPAPDAPLGWLPDGAVAIGRALEPVLASFGRHEPLDELARRAGEFVDDDPEVGVRAVAAAYGLLSTARAITSGELADVPRPFVALTATGPVGVGERDGASPASVGDARAVVTFTPGRNFLGDGSDDGALTVIWRRMRVVRWGYLYAVLAGILLSVPGVVVAALSKTFVNKYLVGGSTDWLAAVLIALVIAAILQMGLGTLQQWSMSRLSRKLSITMSADYLWHLLRLPITEFVARPAGDIAYLMTLAERTAANLGRKFALGFVALITVVVNGVFLVRYSALLMVVVAVMTTALFGGMQVLSQRAGRLNRMLRDAEGEALATASSGIAAIESLKANGAEEALFARWSASYTRSVQAKQHVGALETGMGALPNFVALLINVAVIGIGGAQVISGAMSLGDLVAFQSLLFPFMVALAAVLVAASMIPTMVSDCRRLDRTRRLPVAASIAAGEVMVPTEAPRPLAGGLELRAVTFGYTPGGDALIDDLSILVEPGQRVALVGGSGSGKSTVARLVTGQIEPWSGEILFDGRPRHRHPGPELTHSMAFVQQEIYLFDATVRENLTLWDPTVPDEDVVRAARDARIDEVIAALPDGYDSRILEGGRNLSGGQRQRMEIARALTRNPQLLVLDEATSALDAQTEGEVDANLRRRGCTCLIVAHRLSTIRDCDEIIVLDRGRVAERGTHDALLAAGGPYARLVGEMDH